MLQPGRCPSFIGSSLVVYCTEDSGVVNSKPWPTAAQIVASTLTLSGTNHCCRLAVFFIDYRPHLRATHCPVRAIVDSQHRHHPHHRPSCILRAPHPSETHACRSQQRHSARYLRRLFSPDFTERRITSKDSEHHHRVEHHSRRPRVLPAPHHRLLVSALFHRFPRIVHPRSTQVFHPPR